MGNPLFIIAVSGKTSNTDVSTPTPVFSVRSRCTPEPFLAMVVLERQIFPFLGYPLTAVWLAGTVPYPESPDRLGVNIFHIYAFLSFSFTDHQNRSSCAQTVAFHGFLKNERGLELFFLCVSCLQERVRARLTNKKEDWSLLYFFFIWPVTHLALLSQLKIKT